MKKFTKLLGIVLIIALVMSMGTMALAEYGTANEHTIKITNTDANGAHSYEAYQVFKGNLNAAEGLLSDITWGTGVDGAGILTDLIAANANNDSPLKGKFAGLHEATAAQGTEGEEGYVPAQAASSATDVAKAISALGDNSAELDAVARIINDNLSTTKVAFSGNNTDGYTATVPNDGYYFIKDTTETLAGGDTKSKHMLSVVKDVTIAAKDTSIKPDKEILITEGKASAADYERVKENTAAVGDTVTFEVTIPVPDTTAYKDHFIFNMYDKLPTGLTFTGIQSVTINGVTVPEATDTPVTGTHASYTLTTKTGDANYAAYEAPADAVAAVGGQSIKVVFNNFKAYVESVSAIGKNVVITYTAVVNDDAVYGSTGNQNEVEFKYSTDPNHDYTGDEPSNTDPMGETPKDNTKTFVAGIEILKVDGSNSNNPLANAEFEISSESYNKTVTKGVKYEPAGYTAATGETIQSGDYWKLKDGSYTSTDPATENMNTTQYESTTQKYVKVTWDKIVVEPGTSKKVTFITGTDGIIDVKGLKPGTYIIKETHAPDGYNKIADEIKIVIDWDPTTTGTTPVAATFKLGDGTTEGVTLVADGTSANAIYKIQVINNQGTTLPSTGGIGTTIFYVVGSIMVVAAGVLLITKKRMSREG